MMSFGGLDEYSPMKIKKDKKTEPTLAEMQSALKFLINDVMNLHKALDIIYKKDLKFFEEHKKMDDKFLGMLEELKSMAHTHGEEQ